MFQLSTEETKTIAEWIEQQDNIVRKKQQIPDSESPYYGAIGGEITYCFTPTSLGMIVKVKHSGAGNEIDITDYDRW